MVNNLLIRPAISWGKRGFGGGRGSLDSPEKSGRGGGGVELSTPEVEGTIIY